MGAKSGSRTRGAVLGALAALVVVAMMDPSAEARVRFRSSGVRPHAPSVSRPHVPVPVPRPGIIANAVTRSSSSAMPSVGVDNRGFFRRTWDWLLGRKPPTPAPAPQVPAPAPAAAAASAPANVVVPVPGGIAGPVAAPAAGGPQQDQDARRPSASGVPGVTAAAGGAAGGGALEAALQRSFGRREATAGRPDQSQGPSAQSNADGPTRKPNGYILHLTNGRSIPVAMYEEKGDQVLVTQAQGTYGLPKTLIARIEPRVVETDVAAARGR